MNKDMQQLVLDTCKVLHLQPEQLTIIYTVINLAYHTGWLDGNKESKSDIDIALENGASLDDLPAK